MARIQSGPGPGDDASMFTREALAEAWEYVSDRLVRFPGSSWQEIEALPQPLRWTVQGTIFHLLDEPVPTLADPFPGAYKLHLPADNVTIWYTVSEHKGQEVVSVHHVSLET
jgi:hypothetical protein